MTSTAGKVIQCRAAICWAPNKPLTIETVDVAPPKAHEVRIKIVSTGVCHSDAHIANGLIEGSKFPVILGHEGAGIVESVGEGVTKFKAGDHVIPLYTPRCGDCRMCKTGKTNLCKKASVMLTESVLPDWTSRFTCKGQEIHHFMGCSTFSEYTVVADYSMCKISDKAPFDKVCLIGCGISTGYGAAMNTAKVQPGTSCAIWGLGGIGLAAAMGCRRAGATRIIGIDVNPTKFPLAAKFGCTEFINPLDLKVPIQEHIHAITDGGVDYSFEAVGNTKTMRAALESTTDGWGVAVVIGVAPSNQEISCLPIQLVLGRQWKGSVFGGWQIDDVPVLVEDYMKKKIMVDEFITHTMSLENINEAFDLLRQGKSLRSVINF